MKYSNTARLMLCALFAALTGICSAIAIPLPFTPVPVNLATLAVALAGGLLGFKYGTLSMIVYVLLGAVGAPVFSNFTGGLGILAGPTGGYIIGYISAAFLTGFVIFLFDEKHAGKRSDCGSQGKRKTGAWVYGFAALVGFLSCYALGTIWFMASTGTGLWPALIMCVFPFLPGDALKIICMSLLVKKLRPML
ncbi:MAG: biotin transporter BioY [Anaerovorax sp.]